MFWGLGRCGDPYKTGDCLQIGYLEKVGQGSSSSDEDGRGSDRGGSRGRVDGRISGGGDSGDDDVSLGVGVLGSLEEGVGGVDISRGDAGGDSRGSSLGGVGVGSSVEASNVERVKVASVSEGHVSLGGTRASVIVVEGDRVLSSSSLANVLDLGIRDLIIESSRERRDVVDLNTVADLVRPGDSPVVVDTGLAASRANDLDVGGQVDGGLIARELLRGRRDFLGSVLLLGDRGRNEGRAGGVEDGGDGDSSALVVQEKVVVVGTSGVASGGVIHGSNVVLEVSRVGRVERSAGGGIILLGQIRLKEERGEITSGTEALGVSSPDQVDSSRDLNRGGLNRDGDDSYGHSDGLQSNGLNIDGDSDSGRNAELGRLQKRRGIIGLKLNGVLHGNLRLGDNKCSRKAENKSSEAV